MNLKQTNVLSVSLKNFFHHYLPELRGMSSHTILSYRDTWKLFLQFIARDQGISATELTIEHLSVDEVIAFLTHLEDERGNGVGTRNSRLSAIHCFFRYLAGLYPEYLILSQQILSIPFKRGTQRQIDYLEFEEIQAVLNAVDRSKVEGRRDYLIVLLMFNTGARVQEIVQLKASDLNLSPPFGIQIYGKGRKERYCPIWPETAALFKQHVQEQQIDVRKPQDLFLNHLGQPITRFGIRYLLNKYLQKALQSHPNLKKKRLHPHSMRHSTAIHLLKSGVDLCTIANWLGHQSVNTTNKYVSINLEMKQQALEKMEFAGDKVGEDQKLSWKQQPELLEWLESL